MKKHYGKCALCQIEGELSFEHIPPQSSFNSSPAKPVTGDLLMLDDDRMPWETDGLPYSNQQRGMGKYSLCKSCNNLTGTWYGDDYKLMAHIIDHALSQLINPNVKGIGIREIHPLRFIKQVLSMFCSLNNNDDSRFESLRKFVLDRDAVGLDKQKYKLCMYFTKSNIIKYAPLSVLLRMGNDQYESIALSEITAYPLGFILYFDPSATWEYEGIDITGFSDCAYNDEASVEMPLCIKEVNDIFPAHYRSKEEIIECVEKNKNWAEDNDVNIPR
ncbi:MAG: hypothetical protein IKJ00_07285 [Clostridia bacterium]|nr:hypothetical protein [Clostridia bacterium]